MKPWNSALVRFEETLDVYLMYESRGVVKELVARSIAPLKVLREHMAID